MTNKDLQIQENIKLLKARLTPEVFNLVEREIKSIEIKEFTFIYDSFLSYINKLDVRLRDKLYLILFIQNLSFIKGLPEVYNQKIDEIIIKIEENTAESSKTSLEDSERKLKSSEEYSKTLHSELEQLAMGVDRILQKMDILQKELSTSETKRDVLEKELIKKRKRGFKKT